MSVILYDDEKFLRLAATLKFRGRDIAHVWLYPGDLSKTVEKFAQDLRNANIDASNERYGEEKPKRKLDLKKPVPRLTAFELIKSLRGVAYNCVESEKFKETKKKLRDVIYFLMSKVIDAIPEYEKAQTW